MGLKSLGLKCHLSIRLEDISTTDFSTMNFSTSWFKKSWLKSPGVKSLGLKGPGLKLGVEKSGVEMSFNRSNGPNLIELYFYVSYSSLVVNIYCVCRQVSNGLEAS